MRGVNTFSKVLKSGKLSWGYRFDIAPVNGKRKQLYKSGFKTRKEALKAGMLALQQYENVGEIVTPSDMSLSDYLDLWIEKDCMVDLKPTTILNYQKKIKNQIKPALGGYRLRSIKREDLQAFVIELYDSGTSTYTISSIIGILTKSFNWAVDNKYLQYSPAVRIKIPKNRVPKTPTRTAEREIIPPEAIQKIFARFPELSPNHIPLRLGYECGLRIAEAFGLVWEDVDLENRTITVKRQVQWEQDKTRTAKEKLVSNGTADCGNGYWYFTAPKCNSFRVVSISENLTELLKREQERQRQMKEYYGELYTHYYAQYPLNAGAAQTAPINPIGNEATDNPVNFVCVRACGSYISSRTMQHTSRVIQKDIHKNFSFHCLRHTHASILYAAGLNDKYISERLGHKGTWITKEVYIHLTEQTREQSRAKVDELFNGIGCE